MKGEIATAFMPLQWRVPEHVDLVALPVQSSAGPAWPSGHRPGHHGMIGPLLVPRWRRGSIAWGGSYVWSGTDNLHLAFAAIAAARDQTDAAHRFACRYGLLHCEAGEGPLADDTTRGEIVLKGAPLFGEDVAWWIKESHRVGLVVALARAARSPGKADREALARAVEWSPSGCRCIVRDPSTGKPLWSSEDAPGIIDMWGALGVALDSAPVWYCVHEQVNRALSENSVIPSLQPQPNPRRGSRLVFRPASLLGAIWCSVAIDLCFGRRRTFKRCARKGCENVIDVAQGRRTRLYCSDRCRKLAYEYKNPSRGRKV